MSIPQSYQPSIFVGRNEEVAQLKNFLRPGNPDWAMAIVGVGGIGKSVLLSKCRELLFEQLSHLRLAYAFIDLAHTSNQVEVGILENLAEILGDHDFRQFQHEVNANRNSADLLPIARDTFLDCLQKLSLDVVVIVVDTFEQLTDSASTFFSDTLPSIRQAMQPHLDIRLIVAGRPQPTPPINTIRSLLTNNHGNYIDMQGLTVRDVGDYLKSLYIPTKDVNIPKLHELTNGRPILVSLAAEWLARGEPPETLLSYDSNADFESKLVERVRRLDVPENDVIQMMAHLHRRFNSEILAFVMGWELPLADKTIQSLCRFSFVKCTESANESIQSCALHDEMRNLVEKHVLSGLAPIGYLKDDWSSKVIEYYDSLIDVETDPSLRRLYIAERLHYLFALRDNNRAFDDWWKQTEESQSLDDKETYCTEILRHIDKLTQGQRCKFESTYGDILYRHGSYAQYIDRARTAIDINECGLEWRANLLKNQVAAYTHLGKTAEAIALGTGTEKWLLEMIKSLQSDQESSTLRALRLQLGQLYNQIGYTHRIHGSDAGTILRFYEAASEQLWPLGQYGRAAAATILTNLSYVHHLMGKYDDAVSECLRSLRIKKRVLQPDPYQIGLSQNVLGMIESDSMQFEQGELYFKQALNSFFEADSARGRSLTLVAYGRMLRQRGKRKNELQALGPDMNQSDFVESLRMLEEAISLGSRIDKLTLVEAHNERGSILQAMQRYNEAIKAFQQSYDLAKAINNRYMMIDNLQEIGYTYRLLGNFDLARSKSEEASTLAEEFGATYLYGKAQKTLADVHLTRHEYIEAIHAASNAMISVVLVDPRSRHDSPSRIQRLYQEWLQWIIELLDQLPTEMDRQSQVDYLSEQWRQNTKDGLSLSERYTGYIPAIEDVVRF